MRNIQRLMALSEGKMTIEVDDSNNVEITIDSKYIEGFNKGDPFGSTTKLNLSEGSLVEAIETASGLAVERIEGCVCVTPGQEDGQSTCWKHHDCNDGSCTHRE